jgi:hypothetical protein
MKNVMKMKNDPFICTLCHSSAASPQFRVPIRKIMNLKPPGPPWIFMWWGPDEALKGRFSGQPFPPHDITCGLNPLLPHACKNKLHLSCQKVVAKVVTSELKSCILVHFCKLYYHSQLIGHSRAAMSPPEYELAFSPRDATNTEGGPEESRILWFLRRSWHGSEHACHGWIGEDINEWAQ